MYKTIEYAHVIYINAFKVSCNFGLLTEFTPIETIKMLKQNIYNRKTNNYIKYLIPFRNYYKSVV